MTALNIYKQLGKSISGFVERSEQITLITEMENVLKSKSKDYLCANAQTGVGKTFSYLCSAVNFVESTDKKAVILTGTVALQEQLIKEDIPDFLKHTNKKINYAICKGRGRYLCMNKYVNALPNMIGHNKDQLKSINNELNRGWKGDFDVLNIEVEPSLKTAVSCENYKCLKGMCPYSRQCQFFEDRNALEEADIIVSNYNILLSDLLYANHEKNLEAPEDALWILDEADQISKIIATAFEGIVNPRRFEIICKRAAHDLSKSKIKNPVVSKLIKEINEYQARFSVMAKHINGKLENYAEDGHRSFKCGSIPKGLLDTVKRILTVTTKLSKVIDGVNDWEKKLLEDKKMSFIYDTKNTSELSKMCEDARKCVIGMTSEYKKHPFAKYFELGERDWVMKSTPLQPGKFFYNKFIKSAFKVLALSGTLKTCGEYDYFYKNSGFGMVKDRIVEVDIKSPFNYKNNLKFKKLPTKSNPKNYNEFTEELSKMIPKALTRNKATLVLFCSYKQMNDVYSKLPSSIMKSIKMQGRAPKSEILKKHKQDVASGKWSIIFGLDGFSVGIDLPGEQLERVLITKIKFDVPTGPVEVAKQDFCAYQGKSAFNEYSVPKAAMDLTQKVGRLIRTERDTGTVVFFDKRLWEQGYGTRMAKGLPEGCWS